LRVLSGRLKAVLVASLATVILIGIMAPASTLASDPPGLARFMAAVGHVESRGDYYARNAYSGAYGKYQIMPASWRAWAFRYLGEASAKPTPANQDFVAAAKFRALYNSLGAWRRVAYWWLTGSSRTYGWSYAARRYVSRVITYYSTHTATLAIGKVSSLHRYSETNASITYSGTWLSARFGGYAGGAVKYATRAGARASFAFTGSRILWYGPVGPTRGQARIFIDGTYLKTVSLYASSFTSRKVVFSKSWSTAAKHTIVIEVVGTPGHPYVAIDELAYAS
jgi:Transglycosylase-like domain